MRFGSLGGYPDRHRSGPICLTASPAVLQIVASTRVFMELFEARLVLSLSLCIYIYIYVSAYPGRSRDVLVALRGKIFTLSKVASRQIQDSCVLSSSLLLLVLLVPTCT